MILRTADTHFQPKVAARMRVLFALVLCTMQLAAAFKDEPPIPRPDHTEHARLARWLTHYNTWGTLSTQGQQLQL